MQRKSRQSRGEHANFGLVKLSCCEAMMPNPVLPCHRLKQQYSFQNLHVTAWIIKYIFPVCHNSASAKPEDSDCATEQRLHNVTLVL